jgi:hypothetical protein
LRSAGSAECSYSMLPIRPFPASVSGMASVAQTTLGEQLRIYPFEDDLARVEEFEIGTT